jgi:glycosyltransferase involved in cell wall biosynthesis
MRNILYLVTSTNVGGTERSLLEICRRLDRSRYHPVVVSLKKEGPVAPMIRDLDIEVMSLGMRENAGIFSPVEFAAGLLRLPRLLGGRSFDLLHSFLFRANIFGRLAARRCGIARTVSSYRGTLEEPKPWMLSLDRATLGRADALCTLSESLAAEVRERLRAPPERIAVIPNGIDAAAAEKAVADCAPHARQRLGLSPADLVLASVGRLHAEKGLPFLLEAFRTFLHEHPRAVLLLAGDGPEGESLRKQAEALRIAGSVRFLGTLLSPWELLAAADIFVLASVYEGMPNALLEAMAASLPVVATAVGAVPEMVEDGSEGLVVSPGDPAALTAALERLAWSADLRKEMGARGRRKAGQAYSVDKATGKLENLYERLLA